ncbi:MAG: polyprenyl synthetase family protein, partial [Planctomycetota bacterium]|nr:polyprenyl synthetase family protein [Planctomycetota bacterium]
HNTAVDEDWVLAALGYQHGGAAPQAGAPAPQRPRSFVPLLRDVSHYFDPKPLAEILPPERAGAPRGDKVAETERLSLAWLSKGGKRFRPFVTAAAWQAMTDRDDVPLHVKRVAVAMEVFHKASLIHDDIEDDDDFRYGTAALHRSHTVPVALNIGDYLIGGGYRLVMEQAAALGVERTARIMQRLAHAHVRLCEGQGAELLWRKSGEKSLPPLECLRLYALKTAPAFEAALYAGIVLADGNGKWDRELAEFTKHLGVAYQIQNDLKDVATGGTSERAACGDILKGRPTLLFALALEAATAAEKADMLQAAREGQATKVTLDRLREIYFRHGIPLLATRLAENQRARALTAVAHIGHDGLRALFTFLAATLLD